jgi:hypothetical protein
VRPGAGSGAPRVRRLSGSSQPQDGFVPNVRGRTNQPAPDQGRTCHVREGDLLSFLHDPQPPRTPPEESGNGGTPKEQAHFFNTIGYAVYASIQIRNFMRKQYIGRMSNLDSYLFLRQDTSMIQWLYSYLQKEFGDATQYSYHACRILIDDFSALHHGDAMVVRTFVLCVLGCKSTLYVGTIGKTISRRPGN